MGLGRRKIEGGHKRGHSNMTHWDYDWVIKQETRVLRRRQDREEIAAQMADVGTPPLWDGGEVWERDRREVEWWDDWRLPE